MALITIATFETPVEAHILSSALRDADVECFIFDEHIVSINWLFSNAVGGVKVKVLEDDVAVALDTLAILSQDKPNYTPAWRLFPVPQH